MRWLILILLVGIAAGGCKKSESGAQGFEKPAELQPLPKSKTVES